MRKDGRYVILWIVIGLTALVTGAAAPVGATESPEISGVADGVWNSDEILAEIGTLHPSFAGYWLDEQANAIEVLLTGEADQATAEEIVELLVVAFERPRYRDLEVVARGGADYGFAELFDWYRPLATEVLALDGATMTTIHVRDNRIRFGVMDSAVESEIEELIRQHGVPRQAVTIEQGGAGGIPSPREDPDDGR